MAPFELVWGWVGHRGGQPPGSWLPLRRIWLGEDGDGDDGKGEEGAFILREDFDALRDGN